MIAYTVPGISVPGISENHSYICLCKEKNYAFFLNGEVYSLTRGLLMGDPACISIQRYVSDLIPFMVEVLVRA